MQESTRYRKVERSRYRPEKRLLTSSGQNHRTAYKTIERYTQEGCRPRVCEVSKRQREIFERLGYDPPATS